MKPLPLMSFIPALTPRFTQPRHLAPFVETFEAIAAGESVRAVCSVPPRHMKTETTKHAVAWLLRSNPELSIAYITYAQTPAEKRGREIREIYQRAGGVVQDDANSKKDWRTGHQKGGLWSTSVGGPITGEGFDLMIIDDPVKDRASAESGIERSKLIDWYTDTCSTRLEPGGSVIEIGTRWHVSDLGGYLLATGFDGIILPAIDSEGRALCPERFSIKQLETIRVTIGAYGWASLYMCNPTPRGGALFKDATIYDALPEGLRVVIGVDFAYSTKARSDWSVAVVLGYQGRDVYVLDVVRMQVTAPDFLSRLQALQARYSAPCASYIGGTERGVIDSVKLIGPGLNIDARPATADKFTRAQPVSAAWSEGHVHVPRSAAWLDTFLSEICGFTGVGDLRDDQVDALAAGFDAAMRATSGAAVAARRAEHKDFVADQLGAFEGDPAAAARVRARTPPEVHMSLWARIAQANKWTGT